MKTKLVSLLFLATLAASAGPLKVASYPVVHPIKTQKAVAKGFAKAFKAIFW